MYHFNIVDVEDYICFCQSEYNVTQKFALLLLHAVLSHPQCRSADFFYWMAAELGN